MPKGICSARVSVLMNPGQEGIEHAIVLSADRTTEIRNPKLLIESIRLATDHWMTYNKLGQEVRTEIGNNFRIQDLMKHLNPRFRKILASFGVVNLKVEMVEVSEYGPDTILCDTE